MVSAASAGQVVSGQVFDVWWVHGGANRICLAMSAAGGGGGGWASDTAGSNTARGTGYSQLDTTSRPYITNKNSIAHCFNGATDYGSISANQGTYLGTIYATANGQTGVAFTASASGGGANILGVYNAYNKVRIGAVSHDTVASYTYTSSTWRVAHNNTNNSISYVDGLADVQAETSYQVICFGSSGAGVGCDIGVNRDATTGTPAMGGFGAYQTSGIGASVSATDKFLPLIGYHTFSAMEAVATNGQTNTFYGSQDTNGNAIQSQALQISGMM